MLQPRVVNMTIFHVKMGLSPSGLSGHPRNNSDTPVKLVRSCEQVVTNMEQPVDVLSPFLSGRNLSKADDSTQKNQGIT
jgi:hypothetical protein